MYVGSSPQCQRFLLGHSKQTTSRRQPHHPQRHLQRELLLSGDRAKRLLEIHHGLAISNCDLYDLPNRNYFISLFLKSSTDGQKRTASINVAIVLDVSGSMDGPLKYQYKESEGYPNHKVSRTSLAKKAILMLFDKLEKSDVFSLIIFHQEARTIIESDFVSNLDKGKVEQLVNAKFESGGTKISSGFYEGMKNINKIKAKHELKNYQHRVVMLTDVCDNSVAGQEKLIQQISDSRVSTTIIGVSTDFKSETCQKLIKVKGFNYLCAVENQDLQTYMVDQFDYTFFPCVQNTVVSITSPFIAEIEVFGSVDYDVKYPALGDTFTITKMKSGFPSALTLNKQGKVETKGGLILVKFKPKEEKELPKMSFQIDILYEDLHGQKFINQAEQFYSDEAIRQGVHLFYYTQTMRNLLRSMKDSKTVLSDSTREFYLSKLNKLKEYCPQFKLSELQSLKQIVESQ